MSKTTKPAIAPYSKEFGLFLKMHRMEKQISQASLAKLLNLHVQSVSNWERGLSSPSFKNIVRLTEVLNIKERDMLNMIKKVQGQIFDESFQELKKKIK